MTVEEMLTRIGSQEITDWAAIFSIEDEEAEKANKGQSNSSSDDEDITDELIAAIEADQAGE
ncbi:MAG TPA: hypothetical protein VF974_00950 [Patescibacteria group bacterium]